MCLKYKISKLIINIALLSSVKRVRDSRLKTNIKKKKKKNLIQWYTRPSYSPLSKGTKDKGTWHNAQMNDKPEGWKLKRDQTAPKEKLPQFSSLHLYLCLPLLFYFIQFPFSVQFISSTLCTKIINHVFYLRMWKLRCILKIGYMGLKVI